MREKQKYGFMLVYGFVYGLVLAVVDEQCICMCIAGGVASKDAVHCGCNCRGCSRYMLCVSVHGCTACRASTLTTVPIPALRLVVFRHRPHMSRCHFDFCS